MLDPSVRLLLASAFDLLLTPGVFAKPQSGQNDSGGHRYQVSLSVNIAAGEAANVIKGAINSAETVVPFRQPPCEWFCFDFGNCSSSGGTATPFGFGWAPAAAATVAESKEYLVRFDWLWDRPRSDQTCCQATVLASYPKWTSTPFTLESGSLTRFTLKRAQSCTPPAFKEGIRDRLPSSGPSASWVGSRVLDSRHPFSSALHCETWSETCQYNSAKRSQQLCHHSDGPEIGGRFPKQVPPKSISTTWW